MAAEQHKARLMRAAECFSRQDIDAYMHELYAPDCTVHGYGATGVLHGVEAIRSFYTAFMHAFPDACLEILESVGEGDTVACRFVVKGTHWGEFMGMPATGRWVTLPGITTMRFAGPDGRCVERWSQADMLGLLVQIGTLPEPTSGVPAP